MSYKTVSAETLIRRDEADNNPLMYSMYHNHSINIMVFLINPESRALLAPPDFLKSVARKENKRTPLQYMLMLEGRYGKFKRQSPAISGTDVSPTASTDMDVNVNIDMTQHVAVNEDPHANSEEDIREDSDEEPEEDSDEEPKEDSDEEPEEDSDEEPKEDIDEDVHMDTFAAESYIKSNEKVDASDFCEIIHFLIDPDGLVLLELNEARCLPIHEILLMGCPLNAISLALPPYKFIPLLAAPNMGLQSSGIVLGRNDSTKINEYERYVAFLRSPGLAPLHQALLDGASVATIGMICRHFAQVLQLFLVVKTFENEMPSTSPYVWSWDQGS